MAGEGFAGFVFDGRESDAAGAGEAAPRFSIDGDSSGLMPLEV